MQALGIEHYYYLNLENFPAFYEQVKNNQDPFSRELEEVGKGFTDKLSELEAKLRTIAPFTIDVPQFQTMSNMLSDTIRNIKRLDAQFDGLNPYFIMEVVNNVLGISDNIVVEHKTELRERYFKSMVNSRLLTTIAKKCDDLSYQPDQIIRSLLNTPCCDLFFPLTSTDLD